ncbi:MAG TPA: ATP-binding cassette domain-containing protein [Candidatus Udaeobacter sp.]|jgi:osmoprotectant transport system ATP-binding protein|nr:ATP-binding cassette domain-containing protein [Candidatus Udaeobacter sp.]
MSDPGSAGILFESLERRFGDTVAVSVSRLDIPARTVLALIGPSGCGKSTLLRLAAGLLEPNAGTVTIGGVRMEPSSRRSLRLRMGYVIQEGGLFPHLTARDNVTLVARDLGWAPARITSRVTELGELARLRPEMLDRYPQEISGGQRQRVALMRALMLDPEVLLMDEPLAALDPMIRSGLQQELRDVFERLKKTVLFVTHDMGEAAYVAQEIVIMRDGRMLQRGTLDQLTRAPADPFVTEFIRAQRFLHAPETS